MTEYTVEFVGTGEEITVSDKETILAACLDAGIAQEYSCRVGMCLACSAKIVEGEVNQQVAVARALTEAEAEEYALTCMARPASDLKLDRGKYPPSIEEEATADGDNSADGTATADD